MFKNVIQDFSLIPIGGNLDSGLNYITYAAQTFLGVSSIEHNGTCVDMHMTVLQDTI